MFQDLKTQFDHFFDLEDDQQEALLDEIFKRASSDKSVFTKEMQALSYGTDSPRSIIYEAIWNRPQGWEDFLYEELVKVISLAEGGNEGALEEISSIMYLVNVKDMPDTFYEDCLIFITKKLASPIAEIRSECASAIFDICDQKNVPVPAVQLEALQKLLKDSNFDIRISTYIELKEIKQLPSGFQLSWWDKTRAKLKGKGDLLK